MDTRSIIEWVIMVGVGAVAGLKIFTIDRTVWADPRTRFSMTVLMPMALCGQMGAVVALFRGEWRLAAGCVAWFLLVGIIGASLHPLQSARDMSRGQLTAIAAQVERISLPDEVKVVLVQRACTSLTMLIWVLGSAILIWRSDWHWYTATPVALLAAGFVGSILRFVFAR